MKELNEPVNLLIHPQETRRNLTYLIKRKGDLMLNIPSMK
jgi:hypothetical protein